MAQQKGDNMSQLQHLIKTAQAYHDQGKGKHILFTPDSILRMANEIKERQDNFEIDIQVLQNSRNVQVSNLKKKLLAFKLKAKLYLHVLKATDKLYRELYGVRKDTLEEARDTCQSFVSIHPSPVIRDGFKMGQEGCVSKIQALLDKEEK